MHGPSEADIEELLEDRLEVNDAGPRRMFTPSRLPEAVLDAHRDHELGADSQLIHRVQALVVAMLPGS